MISSKLSDRFVARASRAVAGTAVVPPEDTEVTPGHDRRGFLARVAVVGSALAVNPLQFVFKPGSAYATVCGTCSDGWTAFCCTINDGRNSCPSGSFVAGWWKADNAAYCCGAARYIIDCNATCPTQCACRCSGASCDGRRVCCNQFRYGQCHQEISCYGPVVCRVATCTPPWQYDPSCTSTSATDNATRTHGAPCLSDDCISDIERLYRDMGGAFGVLGGVVTSEREVSEHSGRYAKYQHGYIFQRYGGTPHEVHGPVADEYEDLSLYRGELGYPTTNLAWVGGRSGRYNRFENGIIYRGPTGTHAVAGGFYPALRQSGGVLGPLGYPTGRAGVTAGGLGRYQLFQGGSMWFSWATGVHWVTGAISTKYRGLGGGDSEIGLPTTDTISSAGGRFNRFERGGIYSKSGAGTHLLTGTMYRKYRGLIGETSGHLGYPTSELLTQGPGFRVTFEAGEIALRHGQSLAEVHGRIVTKWRQKGSYDGVLGWPITDTEVLPDGVGRRSRFDNGAVYTQGSAGVWEVHGPIYNRYRQLDETIGSLGYPRSDVYGVGDNNRRCDFQHGTLTYDPDTGDVTRS